MSRRFHTTNNATWFPGPVPYPGRMQSSERMSLYRLICDRPGISSTEIEEAWEFKSNVRSRLNELLNKRHLEMKKQADLFGAEA